MIQCVLVAQRLIAEAKSAVVDALGGGKKDNGSSSSENGSSGNGTGGAPAANGAQLEEQSSKTPAGP
jgi:hypothetical protein